MLPGNKSGVEVTSCQKVVPSAMPVQCRDSPLDQGKEKEENKVPALFTQSHTPNTVTPQIQQTVESLRRSTTCIEGKYKCVITSDRLYQLRKMVENASREHKVFTIKGGWQTLRNALLRRNWVEKVESVKQKPASANTHEDITSNLPAKQDWESPTAYVEKCEKLVLSRLLANHDSDFYWNMRKEHSDWNHRMTSTKIMNRFSRSLYTSKEGLALLLQQMYWHIEPGVATINFPRCHVLGFPDHYHNFLDDFRLTACIGLLKWFVHTYQTENHQCMKSVDGTVPHTAIYFAIDRCNEFLGKRKHLDIDRDFARVWDHEWDQFLTHFCQIIHKKEVLREHKDWNVVMCNASARMVLKDIQKHWTDYNIDGWKNIWILKPGNKCRGRGIQLIKTIEEVSKIMTMKVKYVVQKYIERPLTIYDVKFDIRQWFLISSVQPLMIYMYRENYLRFSSQIFSLENFHESLHLTNHAVQCKYTNVEKRDKALPDENMWDCHSFQAYLKQIGHLDKWHNIIYPGMREAIIAAMLASQDTMDRRPNTFELYGADFMIAEDFTPWLLEINSSPDLSSSTSVTARMCPQMLEDLMKVIIDKRRDPKADTGQFDLIYKQNLPRAPAYLGMNLSVRGRRVFKNRNKAAKLLKEREGELLMKTTNKKSNHSFPEYQNHVQQMKGFTNIPKQYYKGPVIEDFIHELQQNVYHYSGEEHGVDFVPAPPPSSPMKKKGAGIKNERVAESERTKSRVTKSCFVNRKRKEKESSRRGLGQSSAKYLGLFRDWSAKEKSVSSRNALWEKETASILNHKSFMSTENLNKTSSTPQYLSSLSLSNILPRLSIKCVSDQETSSCNNLLTVGVGLNCKSALRNKSILPVSLQNFY